MSFRILTCTACFLVGLPLAAAHAETSDEYNSGFGSFFANAVPAGLGDDIDPMDEIAHMLSGIETAAGEEDDAEENTATDDDGAEDTVYDDAEESAEENGEEDGENAGE